MHKCFISFTFVCCAVLSFFQYFSTRICWKTCEDIDEWKFSWIFFSFFWGFVPATVVCTHFLFFIVFIQLQSVIKMYAFRKISHVQCTTNAMINTVLKWCVFFFLDFLCWNWSWKLLVFIFFHFLILNQKCCIHLKFCHFLRKSRWL